ncbi:STY4851/ECs_5259 family protein [Hyphomonas sp.]|uniref:STY4851/ECs_5259 family protein n=1 Tax=Hyphomonas sp. TaxID=87 RepID=UPI003264C2AC
MRDEFFSQNQNENASGQPLHSYRISEREFDELEIEVKKLIGARRNRSAAKPFVLWASERYRLNFEGGGFSWSFLTDPLRCSLSQDELREMTEIGLKAFGRLPKRTPDGATQYLRTIAAEGGIPVRLLSARGGYRAAIVGLVADLERMGLACPEALAMSFAAKRTARLPLGYRTEEYRRLFVSFAREVLELRAMAPSSLAPHEVEAWLDRERPEWRDSLSLRLDGEAATSLLSEAVAAARRSGAEIDPLRRLLARSAGGQWSGWIEVEDEATIAADILHHVVGDRTRLRLGPTGELATVVPDLMLALDRDAAAGSWGCRRISARRTARFRFDLERAASFVAMADGRYLSHVDLPGAAAIEPSAGLSLWLLSEMGESGPRELEYAGSSSLTTIDPHVWAVLPDQFEPDCTGDLTATLEADLSKGKLWRLTGKGRMSIPDWSVAVTTDADRSDQEEILSVGSLEYKILDGRGAPVHRGVPGVLYRQAGRPFRNLLAKEIRYRSATSKLWKNTCQDDEGLGPLTIARWDEKGIGARLTVSVVPQSLSIRESNTPGHQRVVLFEGLPPGWTLRIAEGAPFVSDMQGVARVELPANAHTKGHLPLIIAGPKGTPILSWTLSLPRSRSAFVTSAGDLLLGDRMITVHDLRSWRIVPSSAGHTHLRIRLAGGTQEYAPTITIPVAGDVALSSFRALLEEVLALGGPDSEIRLRALSGLDQSPRLVLRRHLGETLLEGDMVSVLSDRGAELASDLQLSAVDMEAPDRVVQVEANGLSRLGQGRWFLMPELDGHPLRPPRPYVVAAADETAGLDIEKIWTTREQRVAQFARNLREEKGEATIRKLVGLIGVLLEHGATPGALDQVLALTKVPSMAVRLLLQAASEDLSDLLSLDVHGGPNWIFIPPQDWGAALASEATALRATLSSIAALADNADNLVRQQLSGRIKELLVLRPELCAHMALGLLETGLAGPAELPKWAGTLPSCIGNPERALLSHANSAAQRHVGQVEALRDIRAKIVPSGLEQFHDDIRGLIDAPLFVAEIAFGIRPPPTKRQRIQIVQAIQTDPGAFEQSLPAAVAWHYSRQKT